METTFLEMRCKQVINVCDGICLGHICDMVFDVRTSRILGFIVPGHRNFFNLFRRCPEIFIPYCNICKIGEDVILVEVLDLPIPLRRRDRDRNCDRDRRCRTFGEEKKVENASITPTQIKTQTQQNYYDIDEKFREKIKDDNFPNK